MTMILVVALFAAPVLVRKYPVVTSYAALSLASIALLLILCLTSKDFWLSDLASGPIGWIAAIFLTARAIPWARLAEGVRAEGVRAEGVR